MVAPFSQIEPYIIQDESGGHNVLCDLPGCPGVPNPTGAPLSTASGYFQITNSTWKGAGIVNQGYPTAMSAPFNVQEAVAAQLWNQNAGSDWLGSGSYTGNSKIIAANAALMGGTLPAGQPLNAAVLALTGGAPGASGVSSPTTTPVTTPTTPSVTTTPTDPTGYTCGPQYFGLFGPNVCNPNSNPDHTLPSVVAPSGVPAGQPVTQQTPLDFSGITTYLSSIGGSVGIGILAVALLLIAVWPSAQSAVVKAVRA